MPGFTTPALAPGALLSATLPSTPSPSHVVAPQVSSPTGLEGNGIPASIIHALVGAMNIAAGWIASAPEARGLYHDPAAAASAAHLRTGANFVGLLRPNADGLIDDHAVANILMALSPDEITQTSSALQYAGPDADVYAGGNGVTNLLRDIGAQMYVGTRARQAQADADAAREAAHLAQQQHAQAAIDALAAQRAADQAAQQQSMEEAQHAQAIADQAAAEAAEAAQIAAQHSQAAIDAQARADAHMGHMPPGWWLSFIGSAGQPLFQRPVTWVVGGLMLAGVGAGLVAVARR